MSNELRADLETILEPGIAPDPLDHARQIAAIAAVLHCAFQNAGLIATVVGGAAVEIHAPGIFASGDIDLVVEAGQPAALGNVRERAGGVFASLGFESTGRHWTKGELFVEVPSTWLDRPAETVHVGPFVFRVIAKEALLIERLVGFKHWRLTGHGQQAIDMISAFGDELDPASLDDGLRREGVGDVYERLKEVAASPAAVSDESLRQLLDQLSDQ